MVGALDGLSLSGKAEEFIGEPKANQINFGAEPDKLNPSKTPTIYSFYPVTHCK